MTLFKNNYDWANPCRSFGVRAINLVGSDTAVQTSLFEDEEGVKSARGWIWRWRTSAIRTPASIGQLFSRSYAGGLSLEHYPRWILKPCKLRPVSRNISNRFHTSGVDYEDPKFISSYRRIDRKVDSTLLKSSGRTDAAFIYPGYRYEGPPA